MRLQSRYDIQAVRPAPHQVRQNPRSVQVHDRRTRERNDQFGAQNPARAFLGAEPASHDAAVANLFDLWHPGHEYVVHRDRLHKATKAVIPIPVHELAPTTPKRIKPQSVKSLTQIRNIGKPLRATCEVRA